MAAKSVPRKGGADDPCLQQSLDLFRDRLPRRPLVGDEKNADGQLILYRLPLADALDRLHIQPNTQKLVVCLCFDVDSPTAAMDWEHQRVPTPNITVKNPANGHAHLIYLLEAPVPTDTNVASIKPIYFMEAIKEGLRRALGADRGYAGVVVKNPMHAHWTTREWRKEPYELGELADSVELPTPAEMRKRCKQTDYAGLGRNVTVFEVVRKQSYSLVRDYWGPEGERRFFSAVLELVEASNRRDIGNPLSLRELRGIARSISKWTWKHFNRATFREIQACRGAKKGADNRKLLLPTAQSMAAEGKSQREIAAALGVGQKTISRWLKRGE